MIINIAVTRIVVVLIVLAGFLINIFQAALVEFDEKKTYELVENNKVGHVEKVAQAMETSEKTVEGEGIVSRGKLNRWTRVVFEKLPKSSSFKKTQA